MVSTRSRVGARILLHVKTGSNGERLGLMAPHASPLAILSTLRMYAHGPIPIPAALQEPARPLQHKKPHQGHTPPHLSGRKSVATVGSLPSFPNFRLFASAPPPPPSLPLPLLFPGSSLPARPPLAAPLAPPLPPAAAAASEGPAGAAAAAAAACCAPCAIRARAGSLKAGGGAEGFSYAKGRRQRARAHW